MNKLIFYGILLVIYLGLSKSFSPSEYGIGYINSSAGIESLVKGAPVSVIFTDIHSTGFLIKTYYHKYKIVYGYQSYEELIVKTSELYSEKQKQYLGMSVFRRNRNGEPSFTPLPPGSVFIGDKNLGKWIKHPSGERRWQFFGAYKNLVRYLGWEDFSPSVKLKNKIQIHLEQGKPFFGENQEFGLDGTITRKVFSSYFERSKQPQFSTKKYLKRYFNENFIEKKL
ncbi:MAG: hypothetical protein VYA54_04790 [Bdellovibrionota bacterium]|nr:hypothetical protein [Bdellovibrionota bacterium]